MIFRSLDNDGDWRFGAGKQCYAKNDSAIILNLETSLKTFLSECFFDPNVGLPWFSLIDSRNKDIIVLSIKAAMVESYGIVKVQEIQYTWNDLRELVIDYTIDTIYSRGWQGRVII